MDIYGSEISDSGQETPDEGSTHGADNASTYPDPLTPIQRKRIMNVMQNPEVEGGNKQVDSITPESEWERAARLREETEFEHKFAIAVQVKRMVPKIENGIGGLQHNFEYMLAVPNDMLSRMQDKLARYGERAQQLTHSHAENSLAGLEGMADDIQWLSEITELSEKYLQPNLHKGTPNHKLVQRTSEQFKYLMIMTYNLPLLVDIVEAVESAREKGQDEATAFYDAIDATFDKLTQPPEENTTTTN